MKMLTCFSIVFIIIALPFLLEAVADLIRDLFDWKGE